MSNRANRRKQKRILLGGAINFAKLNDDLDKLFGKTHAYALLTWPYESIDAGMNYVSNCDRGQMIPAILEAAEAMEKEKKAESFAVANELRNMADRIEEIMETQRPNLLEAMRDVAEKLTETDKYKQNPDLN